MKKTYYNTDTIICHYDSDQPIEIPETYQDKDIRALWVSNVANIDLPVITKDVDAYKQLIETLFETCKTFRINTLFFQVRTTNDAFYHSTVNPYSRFFTGEEGQEPPFDVLAWIVERAHQQNIEIHGWCNPYRISVNGELSIEDYLATCDPLNFAVKHPDTIILDDKGKLILNPADQRVKQHIIDSMVELCESYDIDGIHFDDYFYPYGSLSDKYNDISLYERNHLEEESLDDFRRRQVNDVMSGVHQAVKDVDPRLMFSVSPFGIWKNKASDPAGSNTGPQCSESYYSQYADSVHWVKQGYVDCIVPQLYFPFGHPIAPFADLVDFWVNVVRGTKVSLLIGLAAYRMGREGEWSNPNELVDQMHYAYQFEEVQGSVFFTFHNFIDNKETKDGIEALSNLLNKV